MHNLTLQLDCGLPLGEGDKEARLGLGNKMTDSYESRMVVSSGGETVDLVQGAFWNSDEMSMWLTSVDLERSFVQEFLIDKANIRNYEELMSFCVDFQPFMVTPTLMTKDYGYKHFRDLVKLRTIGDYIINGNSTDIGDVSVWAENMTSEERIVIDRSKYFREKWHEHVNREFIGSAIKRHPTDSDDQPTPPSRKMPERLDDPGINRDDDSFIRQ